VVHFLADVGSVVSGVSALGGRRMAGILERVLITGDVSGLLVDGRFVVGLAAAAGSEAGRLTVDSSCHIVVNKVFRLRRRAVERGSVQRLTMNSAEAVSLLIERTGLAAVTAAIDLLLVLLRTARAGLLIERTGLAVTIAVDLLLVLLRTAETAGLLAERTGLAAVIAAAVDLLLVLLRAAGAGLLIERASLTVTVPIDLLLVLLRAAGSGLLIERASLAVTVPIDLLLVLLGTRTGLLIERASLVAVTGADLLLVLLRGLRGQWFCAHLMSYLCGRIVMGG
jgi:hypothetical protein